MPLNKPAVFRCSCNSLAGFPCFQRKATSTTSSALGSRPLHSSSSSPTSSTSSSTLSSSSASPFSLLQSKSIPSSHRRRSYATVNTGPHGGSPADWPKTPNPTPYDIFSMRRDDPYTKHRFFQLVKLYHPDKHSHDSAVQHVPTATRLERYRLIVAANDLLSDPNKRSLYDSQGVGWTGSRSPTLNESVRHAEKSWRHRPGNAARNATWEDWERWYDARDGRTVDSMYMSNGVFATLVVMLCMIGAFAQMSRAEQSGADYVETRNQSNLAIGRQMARSTYVASGQSKDERVDNFLRDRDNLSYEFTPSKYDALQPESEPRARGQPGHPPEP
ncbi:hypothetical protein B0J13DRAFT_219506 [Dactylonectria estremocensis]|uniref:J domain-containing protein n=1 Tax=Dactylonectria estremocensis TaxID=1079267 RepID=A0A9P9J910_9HYPO|nr:hypothetical protein B0J13DRAFT_219506 [Dactylonectria estremocensis]